MSTILYSDKTMLQHGLKGSKHHLDAIIQFIQTEYGEARPEWKHYGKKVGWVLKIFNKKRNVLFVVPCDAFFKVVFTFGDKATDVILASSLT